MVGKGDRAYEPGDRDMGVSVAQIFRPPYLFADAEGTLAVRPVIEAAPDYIEYGSSFNIKVDAGEEVSSISIMRTGARTHTLHTDDRYVKLPFNHSGSPKPNTDTLSVKAPVLPAQAIPGDYMLFVINKNGTPSVAKHVRLLPAG